MCEKHFFVIVVVFVFFQSYDKRSFCFVWQVFEKTTVAHDQKIVSRQMAIFLFVFCFGCFCDKSLSHTAVESVLPLTQRLSHFHHLRHYCCLNP